MVFVHTGGTIVKKQMDGGRIRVDTGCIIGFSPGIDYDIQRAGNLKAMFFGREGLFLATLSGHGTVYLQSLPFHGWRTELSSMHRRLAAAAKERALS